MVPDKHLLLAGAVFIFYLFARLVGSIIADAIRDRNTRSHL